MTRPPEPGVQQQIQIADESGAVRVVLGLLDSRTEPSSRAYGVSVRDVNGDERITLSVDDDGASLVFVRNGNIAIQLGVDDAHVHGDHAGAFVTLADDRGVPLLYLAAEGESLRVRVSGEPPPDSA